MTPDQKHDADPVSASHEASPEVSPDESSSTAGLHDDDRSNTAARDDRRGWRAYFPAAARKELKTEPVEENDSAAAIARLATRLSMLICALFLFVVSASANTYIVSTTADNGSNSNPTFGLPASKPN